MDKEIAIPTEILDKDGNLEKIEFHTEDGEHIADALWDPRDEQTAKNRKEFRQWTYRFIERDNKFKVKT